ncbi:MAG: hypothetical protein GXX82_11035 [Syntrophorhabdus sp.]|nr:hypothetical protein [Syntrophorhabdus sp.]
MIIPLVLIALLCSCKTCRVTSVEDAIAYNVRGYDTRIAIYRTGIDGKMWGAFMWTHHAQAQVYVNNRWKWVGVLGLSDSPTFSVANGEIHYWDVTDYVLFLKKNNIYY